MIIIEKLEEGFLSYSNNSFYIKPIFDRLGYPIDGTVMYEAAEDIEIDGKPRFDYEETDIKIEELEVE